MASKRRDFLAGKLLIAMPNLKAGVFKKSVLLIAAHDEEHAMGLILNKCIQDLTFNKLLEELDINPVNEEDKTEVYYGGPVEDKRGIVMHSMDYKGDETFQVLQNVGLTATREILEMLNRPPHQNGAPESSVLFMGHAGWTAGQLEDEIAQNAWLHIEATTDLIFETPKEFLWEKALLKIGVDAAMLSKEWTQARTPEQPLN